MPPTEPCPEPDSEVVASFQSLAQNLLLLEDRGGSETASDVAANCFQLKKAAKNISASGTRLAAALELVVVDIRDGRLNRAPALMEALLAAADALANAMGVGGNSLDDVGIDAALVELESAASKASLAQPQPAVVVAWPAASGAIPADLLAQFIVESTDSLQEAEAALLELESKAEGADAVHSLFRAVHSIKGTAGYVGLNQIRTLSHKLESVLDLVRSGRATLAAELSEFVFQGVDHLKVMVAELTPAGEVPRDLSGFIACLDSLCSTADFPSDANTRSTIDADAVFREAASQYMDGLNDGLKSIGQGDCSDAVLGLLRRSATSLKTSAQYVGRAEAVSPVDELIELLDRLKSIRDRVMEVACNGGLEKPTTSALPTDAVGLPAAIVAAPIPIEATSPEPSIAKGPSPEPVAAGRQAAGGRTMRVEQRKLDEYVNLAGELVISRNSLLHAHRQFQADPSSSRVFKDAVDKMCRIVGDVQNNAMAMRMVPVGTVFQRFPRLVRDVSKTLGKQIELEMHGEDTELDKQVAEALSDPLVHLVRNAADHGVESPDARLAAGKRAGGVISLRASREGNAILIDIQDDGGGISAERLKAKAVSTGIITAEQATSMSREQALQLVFAPGLSTANVVSDLSGRGVGMDVVRNNIAALGGVVSIRSEIGQGTCIRLSLPLTLAVTTVILVEVGDMTYGLPIDAVQETLKVAPGSFHRLRGMQAVSLRGDIIPVSPLGELIGMSARAGGQAAGHGQINDRVPVVVLTVAGVRFGVVVDALKGQQEIVLKPVPPQLGQIEGVGGATITGGGGIVLILDPAGLYRRALAGPSPRMDR